MASQDPAALPEGSRRRRTEDPEKKRESARRWREANREYRAQKKREWNEANPDRRRELNRLSMRRQAVHARRRKTKNAKARVWYAENREQARARSAAFRQEHPETVRQYQRTYKERHPERYRANAAEARRRYVDKNAETVREKGRLAAARHREANPEALRERYNNNLEAERARSRKVARRRRRLEKLGLPPRRIQRVYAGDRRANAAAADEFFARVRSVKERGRIAADLPYEASNIPASVGQARRAYFNAPDPMPEVSPRILALNRLKVQMDRQTQEVLQERPRLLDTHRHRHEARIREEIRMDSIARQLRGRPPLEAGIELERRLVAEVDTDIKRRLNAIRATAIARAQPIISDERQRPAEPDHFGAHRRAATYRDPSTRTL